MREAAVDALVRGVWAAATGEASWVQALDPVAAHFRARMAVVQRFDLANHRVLAIESGGAPDLEDGVLQYLRQFHQLDTRKASLLEGRLVPHGGWYHDHEHLDEQFVAGDPFYQHFLPAYGCRYVSGRTHAPAPDQACLFALELAPDRGPLNADERRELDRLGGHLDEALRAYERLRRSRAQVLAGHQLLHTFAQPMWLIDTDRFIHDGNAAASAETQQAQLLAQRGPHLVATPNRLEAALRAAMQQLRSQPHGSRQVLQHRLPGASAPVWLHLVLLKPDASVGAFGAMPMVLVTLFDPQQVPAFDPFALSSLLDLTPTQARVATALAQGLAVEQIAAATGTRVATIRSHVATVLDRVGASRSDDLVRRLHDGHLLWGQAAGGG